MAALLAEPFGYGFMIKAIAGGAAVGALCGLLSCFVTLKGWSLLGDALSHAVVPGVAIAAIFGLPFVAGAVVAGVFAVGAIGFVERNSLLKNDAVIGVVFTAMFALGLFLISVFPSNLRLTTILFGNLLGVADADLWQVAAVGALAVGIVALKWKDLLLFCFDAGHARSIGLDTRLLHGVLLGLLSLAAVAALQAVGALLVVAMLITPGATALLLTDRFGRMLVIAPALGALAAALGAYASFFLDGSTGGLIVALQTAIFFVAFLFAPRRGVLAGRRRAAAAAEAAP
ncbi:metal ABC transporter permease [Methylobrevis sp. L22]|uniref:Metal ABC transporter permease n=1 Tax=Methylobrevis albus TaxID=2793297 RepID=A0A931I0F9_9HYPH|nr:metal ABC transporter permease [Methylobrevis albus]